MSIRTTRIQSANNPRLNQIRKDDQLIFFEGFKLSRDILDKLEHKIEILVALQDSFDTLQLPPYRQIGEIWLVSPQVMSKLSDLKSIPSMIAIMKRLPQKIDFKKCRALLALYEVQDPGNVGTLIRTASAFGFDGVVQIGSSVKLSNRKLIRSAQNAVLNLPIQHFDTFSDFVSKCRKSHMAIYLSSANHGLGTIGPEEIIPPCAVVLGNEGSGFDKEILSQFPSVRIPQSEEVESLNVSVSGSILMHELRKKWGYE